jgi:hypothetical protein
MFQFQPLAARFWRTFTESIWSCVLIVARELRSNVRQRASGSMSLRGASDVHGIAPSGALAPGAPLATPPFDVVIVN